MYSDKINGFITPSVPPLSLLLWITSGRLDRSVYKQGQVVYKKQNLHKHQQYIIQFWNAMYWMYSGRLDRSVYKQGQVVCPTVECTVEKGEDGSLCVCGWRDTVWEYLTTNNEIFEDNICKYALLWSALLRNVRMVHWYQTCNLNFLLSQMKLRGLRATVWKYLTTNDGIFEYGLYMLILHLFGNICNELWVIWLFLTSAWVFM